MTPALLAAAGAALLWPDGRAVARLDLVRTLRLLGVGLPAVRELLAPRRTVAQVASGALPASTAARQLLALARQAAHGGHGEAVDPPAGAAPAPASVSTADPPGPGPA